MKRLLFILGALLLCCPVWGAIAPQGSCSGATSCTPGSAAVGAVEYAFVYRSGSTTGATVPSGWTTVATYAASSGGTPGVMRVACRVDMSATAAASGTFTNATNLGIVSYKGTGARSTSDCNLSLIPIGGSSNDNAQTSTTVSYDGITMSDSSGNSWIIAAQGDSSSSNTCTPSSLTNVAGATTGAVRVSDSHGGVTSFATSTCSVSSSTWVTSVFEIVVHQAQAAIPSQVFEAYGSMSNLTDRNNEGNNFTWIAANASPAGNTIAFAINWLLPTGCSSAAACKPTISDDKSNSYTDIEDCTNSDQSRGTSVLYTAGVAAGTQKFVINFSGYGNAILDFHFSYINLRGIATTSPTDGQNCSVDAYPSANSYDNIVPGSITTTANGDVIWATVNSQGSPGGGPLQDIIAHSGFALLTATNNLYDSAQEIMVQNTAGAINPGFGMMVEPGDEYDYYGATVVAFKTDSSRGSGYSGIHILSEQQVAMRSTSPQTLVFPSSGNLMVIAEDTQGSSGSAVIGTMPTSPAWTVLSANPTYSPMITYSANATGTDSSTIIYITMNNADQISENTYLINVVGAAANQPDASATCGGSSSSLGAGTGSCSNLSTQVTVGQTTAATISNSQTNIPFTANTTCANGALAILDDGANAETVLINDGCGTSMLSVTRADGTAAYYYSTAIAHPASVYIYAVPFSDGPTITPSIANGLVIAEMNTGIGPPASSTNCVFNQTWHPGMNDGSYLSYGDGHCNVYPTSASAINIGWAFQNASLLSGGAGSGWDALATSFLAASGGGGGGGTPVLVTVTPANARVPKGQTQQFTAIATYSDGSKQDVTTSASWSSRNTAVANVTNTGLVTGVLVGNTTIEADINGVSGVDPLIVIPYSVLTYHNDVGRTGQNLQETSLSLANVNVNTFGKLFTIPVDGKVDAEPLYVSNLNVAGKGTHNLLIVATEHDTLYAFDADTGTSLWQVSMLKSGETTSDARNCDQVFPEIGITSTPVIDLNSGSNGTVYVVAMSKDASNNYHQRLHALNLATGAEEFGGPTDINATYPGTASLGSVVLFDPAQYKERAGLLLLDGAIYMGFASHCDNAPYSGWIMGYDENTLQQVRVFNFTPNGQQGSVWMAGAGLAADSAANIYFLAANGTFDTALDINGFPSKSDYGNAFLKLSTSSPALVVADYFTMYNTVNESAADEDLGSGGVLILPDLTDAQNKVWRLAVGAGKDGDIYVVNRDNMGKFSPTDNSNVYQDIPGVLSGNPDGAEFGMAAFFNNTIYYGAVQKPLMAFPITNARLASSPSSTTIESFGYPGTTPSVSANYNANGIVWVAENGSNAILHAYDASNLGHELYNSTQASNNRDTFGTGNKFITPMVVNGKVYVGTTNGVGVFGLLSQKPKAHRPVVIF